MSWSKVKVIGEKKTKKCGILFGSRPLGHGPRAAFYGAVLGGAVHYTGGKISACCVVVCLFVCQHDNFQTIQRRMMKLGG